MLWGSQIITDRDIPYNKPDIIIKEKDTDTFLIIDVAIPSDYNIYQKAVKNQLVI